MLWLHLDYCPKWVSVSVSQKERKSFDLYDPLDGADGGRPSVLQGRAYSRPRPSALLCVFCKALTLSLTHFQIIDTILHTRSVVGALLTIVTLILSFLPLP